MTPPSTWSTAEIIAVGTELLTPYRSDTNSLFLTAQLNELGVTVRRKSIVGDRADDLASVLREALSRVDLVIVCGGLGATEDDLTRETAAAVLGWPLREDSGILAHIRSRFAKRGWEMPDNNRRQAQVPVGAVVLDNPQGTAPGLWLEDAGRVVVLLPGPPRELQPMFAERVRERLAQRATRHRLYRRVLRIAGRGESHVEELAQPIYSRWSRAEPRVMTSVLASPGLVELHLSVRTIHASGAEEVLDGATAELVGVLGDHVFSTDGRSLPEVVGELLKQAGYRVGVGESCTGGLVTARLVDVPGSSRYVVNGVVAYSNEIKQTVFGIEPSLLESHGAVSEEVASEMAAAARRMGGADIGLGVTGVAGPGGGTETKPVGMVCFGVSGPGEHQLMKTVHFQGGRAMVRQQATQTALDLLRRVLLGRARDGEIVHRSSMSPSAS